MNQFSLVNIKQLQPGDVYYKHFNDRAVLSMCGVRDGSNYEFALNDPSDGAVVLMPYPIDEYSGSAVLLSDLIFSVDPSSLCADNGTSLAKRLDAVIFDGKNYSLKMGDTGYWFNPESGAMSISAPETPWAAFERYCIRETGDEESYLWGHWDDPTDDHESQD